MLGKSLLPSFKINEQKQDRNEKEQTQREAKLKEVLEQNNLSIKEFNSALINGFDLASMTGPLMDEPMQGAIFIIEDIMFDSSNTHDNVNTGPFAGQIMSTMKTLCKRSFLNSDPRVVEGMYMCSMQASPETYGIVYSIINKFRGRVIGEEI